MGKFNKKFLEELSEIIYNDPKSVRVVNKYRHQYSLIRFQKHAPGIEELVNETAWRITLSIQDAKTKLTVAEIMLTEGGWAMTDTSFTDTLTGKEHLLFKPLPTHIEKIQEIEEQKELDKIEEKFIKKQTSDVNPLTQLYNEMKDKAEGKTSQRVTALGKGNPALIDFTKAPTDD
jgi:hypothetical protein